MIRKYRRRVAVLAAVGALSAVPFTTPGAQAAVKPGPRVYASMAYDAGSKKLVLFGGSGSGEIWRDTWIWTGTQWKNPKPASPPARDDATMAGDPDTKGAVLFAGRSASGTNLADTWAWNGVAKTWTEVTPAASPPARSQAAMAKDAANGNVVLFGGASGNVLSVCAPHLADTWLWDASPGTWTQVASATSPLPTARAAMAYDGATKTVVLFGGTRQGSGATCGQRTNQTWLWDGTTRTWTDVTPAVTPPARADAMMTYDAARKKVVLFGGDAASGELNDTWLWDGVTKTWAPTEPVRKPVPRDNAVMEYHPPTKTVILFGGAGDPNAMSGDETWSWNGSNWKRLS